MPVVHAADAPVFAFTPPGRPDSDTPQITVRGYAAPSRGSTENCMWRLSLAPQVEPWVGTVDREEIFFVVAGRAVVTLDGVVHKLEHDDVLVIPPHITFGIGNPHDETLEMIAVLPVGGKGWVGTDQPFIPPWTV